MCLAKACAAAFSLVTTMTFKVGSITSKPAIMPAAARVFPAPNTPLMGQSVRPSKIDCTSTVRTARKWQSGFTTNGRMACRRASSSWLFFLHCRGNTDMVGQLLRIRKKSETVRMQRFSRAQTKSKPNKQPQHKPNIQQVSALSCLPPLCAIFHSSTSACGFVFSRFWETSASK